jgi:glycosyltransferase involved in cell wall biosynthesis
MQPVLISLVVTTYNRAALLAAALKSVAASRFENPAGVEVIVVDNNSTDGTRQTVAEIQAGDFPFVLRYVLESQQGLSYARNRGIDESKGQYVAFMDDDQLLDQDYLAKLEPAFRSTGAICVGGPLFYYNKESLPKWLPALIDDAGERNHGDEIAILSLHGGRLIGGNMVFVRRELLDIGKYDVTLGRSGASLLAGEEDELQDRLHRAGKRVAYHPGLIQYHYLAPVRLTKRYWRRQRFDYGRTTYRKSIVQGALGKAPSFFGAPRWYWGRLLMRDIPRAVWPLARMDLAESFYRQLDVWRRLGEIHEARCQAGRVKVQ